MKKLIRAVSILITLCFVGIGFNSCCEKEPPGIDKGDTRAADSSYKAPVEAKQEKVIFIEELSGVQCQNCPKGTRAIKAMAEENPGRILAVAMHHDLNEGTLTHPIPNKSQYDLRQKSVNEIISYLGGKGGLPAGAFDRTIQTSGWVFVTDPSTWSVRVEPLLNNETKLNIHLESEYNAEKNNGELIARVALTENISQDIFISAYIIEDAIIDYQLDGDEYISDYEHNHVFRKILTSVSGSSLNYADKNAGTVLQKRIPFEANLEGVNAWNLDNCKIIAFVHKSGSNQSVLQAVEVKLK